MNARLASAAAAVVLSVSAAASPALAQSYTAPAGIPAATAPGGFEGQSGVLNSLQGRQGRYVVAPRSYDDLSTGSISRSNTRGMNSAR